VKNFKLESSTIVDLSLSALKNVLGNFQMMRNRFSDPQLTSLESVVGHLQVYSNKITNLNFQSLVSTGGDFFVNEWDLDSIGLPKLETVGKEFDVSMTCNLEELEAPLLRSVGLGLTVQMAHSLDNINMPNLETVGDDLQIGPGDDNGGETIPRGGGGWRKAYGNLCAEIQNGGYTYNRGTWPDGRSQRGRKVCRKAMDKGGKKYFDFKYNNSPTYHYPLKCTDNWNLKNVNFTNVKDVGGILYVSCNTQLDEIDMASLETIGVKRKLYAMPGAYRDKKYKQISVYIMDNSNGLKYSLPKGVTMSGEYDSDATGAAIFLHPSHSYIVLSVSFSLFLYLF
jgi:hypothetical protein